jgi:hypothetical protein
MGLYGGVALPNKSWGSCSKPMAWSNGAKIAIATNIPVIIMPRISNLVESNFRRSWSNCWTDPRESLLTAIRIFGSIDECSPSISRSVVELSGDRSNFALYIAHLPIDLCQSCLQLDAIGVVQVTVKLAQCCLIFVVQVG